MLGNYKKWILKRHKTAHQTTKKVAASGFVSQSASFIKKYRLAIVIVVAVISAATATFNFVPVVSINKLKLVNLGTSVRLEMGHTVKLKNANVSVQVIHFTNDTCPQGSKCFWSGQAVEYALSIDGKIHATGSMLRAASSPYQIETVASDYKTYAIVKIIRS